MNKNSTVLLLGLGILLIANVYNSYHEHNMFRIIAYIIFGVAFFILLVSTIWKEIEKFKLKNKLSNITGSILGILVVLIILVIIAFNEYKLNKPSLLKAGNYGQYFDLKTDGTCYMFNGEQKRYGKYRIQDSTVIFDQIIKEDSFMVSNRFEIKKLKNVYESEEKDKFENYLVQIDSNRNIIKMHGIYAGVYGQIAYVSFNFEIFEDNRK